MRTIIQLEQEYESYVVCIVGNTKTSRYKCTCIMQVMVSPNHYQCIRFSEYIYKCAEGLVQSGFFSTRIKKNSLLNYAIYTISSSWLVVVPLIKLQVACLSKSVDSRVGTNTVSHTMQTYCSKLRGTVL